MTATAGTLIWALLSDSIRDPRRGIARVLTLNPSDAVRWMALALVVSISVILSALSLRLLPAEAHVPGTEIFAQPFKAALVLAAMLALAAMLIHRVGRAAGGDGNLRDAFLVVIWLQLVMCLLQAVQMVLTLVLPLAAALAGLGFIALIVWLASLYVAQLHGFRSPLRVFVGLVAGFVATVFVLSLLLAMLGFAPPGAV